MLHLLNTKDWYLNFLLFKIISKSKPNRQEIIDQNING